MASLPDLGDAAWLAAPAVRRIFAVLDRDGDEARIVGGAVRDALLGRAVGEIDFATTATPDVVGARAGAAGIRVVPTGIDHGTVTLVVEGTGYEVTTLREDVETDGRHAVVRFGRDWAADARRRDFTLNALSVDAGGHVHDPVGGYPDLVAGRVRFIGDADRRIAEDRLRILRFFRFHAQCGRGRLDRDGLAAVIRARAGLRDLSRERIGQEMRRLVMAAGAVEAVAAMQEAGILGIVLAGIGYPAFLARLVAFEAAAGAEASVALRLAALGCLIGEDALRLAERLRLANAERDRMTAALAAAGSFRAWPDARTARRLLYGLGREAFADGAALAFAWSGSDDLPAWHDLYGLPSRWEAPRFPLSGRDLLGAGAASGRGLGEMLRALEGWWVDEDFAPDEPALRSRLQQMLAAAQ